MGGLENAMGIQNGNRGTVNCPLSDLRTSVSETTMPLEVVNNPFLASSSVWDPLVSLSHSEFAHSAYPLGLENQGMSGNSHSHLIQHTSDSNFADMVPNVTSFGSGNLSEIVGSFSQNEGFNFKPNQNQMRLKNNEQSQVEGSKEDETGSAPSENRRKRGLDYNSTLSPSKDAEGDAIKDSSGKSSEQYEKKPKVEENSGVKQAAKQKKDESHSGEAPKENYVHVRARRGQATNSHSLAERVRREKISERMRLLQELVPGCNKITGKALMLDEIINYVQSLQQQVEFLSMKLATVNPELNFDVERILSKDIIQSRIGHGPIGGYGAAISSSHPLTSSGSFQGSLSNLHTTSTQFPPLSQAVLDQEFQNLFGIDNSGPNDLRMVVHLTAQIN